jgi:hypothetical protein
VRRSGDGVRHGHRCDPKRGSESGKRPRPQGGCGYSEGGDAAINRPALWRGAIYFGHVRGSKRSERVGPASRACLHGARLPFLNPATALARHRGGSCHDQTIIGPWSNLPPLKRLPAVAGPSVIKAVRWASKGARCTLVSGARPHAGPVFITAAFPNRRRPANLPGARRRPPRKKSRPDPNTMRYSHLEQSFARGWRDPPPKAK